MPNSDTMTAPLPAEFVARVRTELGTEADALLAALESESPISVRWNPYKTILPPSGEEVPWNRYGRYLPERPYFTADPMFHAGCYYVQDSSSMFTGHVLRCLMPMVKSPGVKMRVLDLCASPGGKTTDLAASLREVCGSSFVLVSNEVVSQRASVLASNAAVWGDPCVAVTSSDPSVFASMAGWFDVILADVPCSGEGMFRKDTQALQQWSEDNVKLCQARQRRIAGDVWPALAEGGVFIYSTCTFNRYENDCNVQWISGNLGAENISSKVFACTGIPEGVLATESGFSLVPGLVEGEGQYCAALVKTSGGAPSRTREARGGFSPLSGPMASEVKEYFAGDVDVLLKDGFVKVHPAAVSGEMSHIAGRLNVLSSGCAAGEFKKNDVDLGTALSYLHGDQPAPGGYPAGYMTVCYGGLPLGFVKNLGNRCNSLYPRSRRIRMDIGRNIFRTDQLQNKK